jgi:hypothetical protein
MNLMVVASLGAAAWFLMRSPGSGQPSLLSSFLSSAHGVPAPAPAVPLSTLPVSAAPASSLPAVPPPPVPSGSLVISPSGVQSIPTPATDPNYFNPGSVPPPGGWAPFDPLLLGSGYYGKARM